MMTSRMRVLPLLFALVLWGCPQGEFGPVAGKDAKDAAAGDVAEVEVDVGPLCEEAQPECKCGLTAICGEDLEWDCGYDAYVEDTNAGAGDKPLVKLEEGVLIDLLCDGVDADCDGVDDAEETDDFATLYDTLAECAPQATQGVCCGKIKEEACTESKIKYACVNDDGDYEFQCDYSGIKEGYVEDEGFNPEDLTLLCDGKDNDCDGEIDENTTNKAGLDDEDFAALVFGPCVEFTGVCGLEINVDNGDWTLDSHVAFGCNETKFECAYDVAVEAGYEAEIESKCDGLDNDCDGEIDEFPDAAEAAKTSPCLNQGVCKGRVEAYCQSSQTEDGPVGEWVCEYASDLLADPEFQPEDPIAVQACIDGDGFGCGAETLCDGLDNDCDGKVDEGLSWPQHCWKYTDADGQPVVDCESDECFKNHPVCLAAQAVDDPDNPGTDLIPDPEVGFDDCPVLESKKFGDHTVTKYPVLVGDGRPLLYGVCDYQYDADAKGEQWVTQVRLDCQEVEYADGEETTAKWTCNYDVLAETGEYTDTEEVDADELQTWCDAKDNDCDGVVDGTMDTGAEKYITVPKSQTELIPLTPCRFLGECAGKVSASCNKDGEHPGQWTCLYGSGIEIPSPEECPQGVNNGNCIWKESECDGKDNDCDSQIDELLDGMGHDKDIACAFFKDKGVCGYNYLNTSCSIVDDITGDKGFVCDFDGVPEFYPEEAGNAALCDGLDNDCDGFVDEDILVVGATDHKDYGTGCLYQGVCAAGALASCANEEPIPGEPQWECDYAQVQNHFDAVYDGPFGLKEYKCDGLDNDCDGEVDEELDADFGVPATNPKFASGCPLEAYCGNGMKWSCKDVDGDPTWDCDSSNVPFYELEESSCDGVDNDCDGQTDEELFDTGPGGASCKTKGVCSDGGVFAECKEEGEDAFWVCHYDLVSGYDLNNPDNEVLCDGLDNDCDGQVDEGLEENEVWKTSGGCITIGVCDSELLQATCNGVDGWSCLYSLVENYVPDEKKEFDVCDGLDNDCDGAVDELACDTCEACQDDGNCELGACNAVPSVAGNDHFCSLAKKAYCVFVDPSNGACDFRQSGEKACGTLDQPCVCNEGLWYCDIPDCKGSKPLCYEGDCVVCVPFDEKCEGKSILRCDSDGLSWSVKGVCGQGQICVADGKCVPNDELKVNIKDVAKSASTDVNPRVAARAGGGFMVVYQSDGVPGSITEVAGRVYDEQLQPMASEFVVNAFEKSSNQEVPDIAAIPTADGGFIVVWEDRSADGDNSGPGISGQIVSNDGTLVGQRFRVNSEIEGDQENPHIAALYHEAKKEVRFLVIWENEIQGAENQPDIMGRLWKLDVDGNPVAMNDDQLVSTNVEKGQRYAAVGNLAGSGFAAAWSSAHIDSNDVFQQHYDAGMSPLGVDEMVNVITDGSQKNPSVAGFVDYMAEDWVVAFDSYGPDGSKAGVFMQLFPDPEAQDIAVNNIWDGQQREPAVAILENNEIIVTWESEKLNSLGDADKLGVVARQFDENGYPVQDDEFLVNQTFSGDQRSPHVSTLVGGAYVITWASATTSAQGLDYDIYVRLFAPDK